MTILLTPNPAGDEVTLLNEGFIWQSYPAWMRVINCWYRYINQLAEFSSHLPLGFRYQLYF